MAQTDTKQAEKNPAEMRRERIIKRAALELTDGTYGILPCVDNGFIIGSLTCKHQWSVECLVVVVNLVRKRLL